MDPQEVTLFMPVASPMPGEFGFHFRVPHSKMSTLPTVLVKNSTTYAASGLPNRQRLPEKLAGHAIADFLFKEWQDGPEGHMTAVFYRSFSSGDSATAFETVTEWRRGISWPAVLYALDSYNFSAYDQNGVSYIANTLWFPYVREAFDGVTKVIIERYLSNGPFAMSTAPETLNPQPIDFQYGLGRFALPETLHEGFTMTYTTGTANARYPYQTFSLGVTATSPTDWPASYVIEDVQKEVNGYWLRQKTTAYKPARNEPSISLPTEAALTSTSRTLGGTVTADNGYTVTQRGVVYSITATNPNPFIGATGVTKLVIGSGTGLFTGAATGLTTGTPYTFKAFATNSQGTSYTALGTFTPT